MNKEDLLTIAENLVGEIHIDCYEEALMSLDCLVVGVRQKHTEQEEVE